jgi:hypothetical protein
MSKVTLSLGRNRRSCEECTKCCEGWLTAEINGKMMYPGNPCEFVQSGVGCSIYKNRPKEPCKIFECSWKASDFVPIEFNPKAIGQVISTQVIEGIPYMLMSYAGKEVTAEMLSWFVTFVIGRQLNAEWSVGDKVHAIGSPDFISARNRRDVLAGKEK